VALALVAGAGEQGVRVQRLVAQWGLGQDSPSAGWGRSDPALEEGHGSKRR
jgi:hypothetical protein